MALTLHPKCPSSKKMISKKKREGGLEEKIIPGTNELTKSWLILNRNDSDRWY